MRFLIRLQAVKVPKDHLLEATRTVAKTFGADAKNPKWTSYGALELDIFGPSRADFDLFVEAVRPIASVEFTKDLNVAPKHEEEAELFLEARELFNAERYWECHEVLEGIWRQKHGDEKQLLQGIILVCAAFVHHQKGEEAVAIGVLKRSLPQLRFSSRSYGGFDVAMLKENAEGIMSRGQFSNFRV